jgi:hypothetical protein
MSIEGIGAAFGVLFGLVGLYDAYRARRLSIRAPILKLSFCHPNTRKSVTTPSDPRRSIEIHTSSTDYAKQKERVEAGEELGFYIPFVIKNVGTRTARQIKVHARYSPAFAVSTGGKKIEDGDRPNWMVFEHDIPDLHPQQSYTYEGDFLIPDERAVHGFKVKVPVTFRDNVSANLTLQVQTASIIEIAVFADDLEPVFRRAKLVPDCTASEPG